MYLFIFCTQESQAIISFLRKAIIIKLCLSLKNKKPNTALFQQNSGLCSFTDMPCCFFGFYACIHGVTSAKNVVSFCLGSFRLLQQNTDRVVFEQKCIVHGSGAWKSEMRIPARWGDVPLLGHRLLIASSPGGSLWGGVSFIKALIPFMRVLPSRLNHLPPTPSNLIMLSSWRLGFNRRM